MSYSIYFHTTEEEDQLLRRVVPQWLDSVSDYGFCVGYNGDDLGYCSDDHKGDSVFGLNYGEQERAYALLYTIGTALGKTHYWYDGHEWTEFNQLWWRKPRKQWLIRHRLSYSKAYYDALDSNLAKLSSALTAPT